MTNLTIQLDADALRAATVQAIAGVLTPETKEKILQNAVAAVLTPSTNSWERGVSPLETALQGAVLQIAREEAVRIVNEDKELAGKIKGLIALAALKMVESDSDKLAQKMADAFVHSFRER